MAVMTLLHDHYDAYRHEISGLGVKKMGAKWIILLYFYFPCRIASRDPHPGLVGARLNHQDGT